jgi:hypothetical protein
LQTLDRDANLSVVFIKRRASGIASLFAIFFACLILLPIATTAAASPEPLTVAQARTLPTHELATQILGDRLAAKVIEAVRHEGSDDAPSYVEFYTKPTLTRPRLNGICRTDVITAEYELMDASSDTVSPSAPLDVTHVQAKGRYKAFPVPPGDYGTPENERAQAEACARMTTAVDAFHAPSAGDAQWLAAIEAQYSDPRSRFPFSCDDFADRSCAKAQAQLPRLKLNEAKKVEATDCANERKGDQIDLCYRLSFPYPGEECSDRQDSSDFECSDVEWVLTVFAGMKEGDSPVRILSLHLEHQRRAVGIP